jgi:hypothetical protein
MIAANPNVTQTLPQFGPAEKLKEPIRTPMRNVKREEMRQ